MSIDTPEKIKPHGDKYVKGSWANYSFLELYMWSHLLAKRSHHRTDPKKRVKDRLDADNYQAMLDAKLNYYFHSPRLYWALLIGFAILALLLTTSA